MEGGRLEGEGALNARDARAFVFDLDGTLATIPVDWEAVRTRLKAITGSAEEFRPIFPTIGRVIEADPKLERPVFDVIDGFEWTAVPKALLYEGAFRLLSGLASRATVSLVTMQGRRSAEKVLEMYDLKRLFSSVFTREDSLDRAQQVKMAIEAMKADADKTLFVGDRLNDLNAAKELGIPFVLVRTHGSDPEEPVPVYHSLAEFAAAVL